MYIVDKIKKLLLAKKAKEESEMFDNIKDDAELLKKIEKRYSNAISCINNEIRRETLSGEKSIAINLPDITGKTCANDNELKYLKIYFDKKGYIYVETRYHIPNPIIKSAYITLSWK